MRWLVGSFCFPSPFTTSLWQLQETWRTPKSSHAAMRFLMLRYALHEFRKLIASLLPVCYGICSMQFRGGSKLVFLHTDKGRNKGETIHLWLLWCFLIKISSISHNKRSIPPIHQNNTRHPEWGFCSRFLRNDNTRSLEGSSSPNETSNFSEVAASTITTSC